MQLAQDYYRKINQVGARSPLVRLNAQWIELFLGDRQTVTQSLSKVGKDRAHFSRDEQFEWEILSGKLSREEVLETAGPDRLMTRQGLVCLGLTLLSQGDRGKAIDVLKEAEAKDALHFPYYVAKAVLYRLDEDPDWPSIAGLDIE